MTRYSSTMSEAYKKVIYRDSISERDLTDTEEKRREEIAKDLPDQEFKDRYGARWKSVKMATATKMAKKESLEEAREKPARQLLNPNREEMVVKKNTVIVIDKKELDKYLKRGWELAEEVELKEMNPTDHVKKKGDKYCVYNADGSIAKEFDNKEDADKYAIANHDKLMAKESAIVAPGSGSIAKPKKAKSSDVNKSIEQQMADARKEEAELDEAVADLFVKKGDVNKIAVKIAKSAKGLGLKSGVMGNQVRVKGSQKNVNDFMRAVIGKSSLGGPSEVGASNPQIDKILNKQLKEEVELDEGRYVVHAKKQGKKPVGMMTIKHTIPNAKNEKDAIKQAIAMSKTSGGGLKGDEITQKDIVKVVKETLDEKLKFTHAVLEPDGNVLGFSSNERDAKDMARNNLRNVKGKVVTLKKPMAQRKGDKMIGYPLKEEVELDEQFDYVLLDKDNKIIARYKGRDAKKQAELNKKGAEKKLGVKKPIKVYPIRPTDKKKIGDTVLAIGEAKLIDKPTGEVLKTGSKKEMETERKRNRDELQVKEWFKSKGIDVTIRKLDDATQAYVKLGKIIPNEIREDLVKIQYGELPEDIKNTNNIVYGNFKENSVTMNNEFWKKVFEARKDDPSQEQDTNIIMQLRKSVSLKGMKDVEFNDGKKVKVKPQIANAVMDKFDTYRTTDQKLKFQQKIAKSYKDLLSALKEK